MVSAPARDMKVRAGDEKRYVEIIIGRELEGTPLENQEANYVKYGDQYNVDPLLAIAIAFHESKYCKAYADWYNRQYNNCAGIMNGGQENGLIKFDSYEMFISNHMKLLANYIYKNGRDTISEIGRTYAPVESHFLNASWQGSVTKKYHALWNLLETR